MVFSFHLRDGKKQLTNSRPFYGSIIIIAKTLSIPIFNFLQMSYNPVMEPTLLVNLAGSWLIWHFSEVPGKILLGWGNFLKFNLEYFSIKTLLRTLFSPWRKQVDQYGNIADFGKNAEIFIINSFSRLIGALIRIVTILIGLFIEVVIFFLGLTLFIVWFVLPLIALIGVIFSFTLIF